jgi:hypothetical protein
MHFSQPLDMVHGWAYVVLGPIYGILLLLPTIPLEAVFLKFFLRQPFTGCLITSAKMNFASAVIGVLYFSSFAFVETDSNIGWLLTFLGTLIIEYIFLFWLVRPRPSWWKLLLFDILANIASYALTIAIYYILFIGFFAISNAL